MLRYEEKNLDSAPALASKLVALYPAMRRASILDCNRLLVCFLAVARLTMLEIGCAAKILLEATGAPSSALQLAGKLVQLASMATVQYAQLGLRYPHMVISLQGVACQSASASTHASEVITCIYVRAQEAQH